MGAVAKLLQKDTGEKVYCWYNYDHGATKDAGSAFVKGDRVFFLEEGVVNGTAKDTEVSEGGIRQVENSNITGEPAVGAVLYIDGSGVFTMTAASNTPAGVVVEKHTGVSYVSFK